MAISIVIGPQEPTRPRWPVIITGNPPAAGSVNKVVTVGSWDELRALLKEYDADRRTVSGQGVEEMLVELGQVPEDL